MVTHDRITRLLAADPVDDAAAVLFRFLLPAVVAGVVGRICAGGFAGVMTEYPSSCRRRISPSQPEASAQAPCTRTTVGEVRVPPVMTECPFALDMNWQMISAGRGPPRG